MPAVTCLGGVSALLGLVIVPRLPPPAPPPRHWQERNRKGRAKISRVVVGWPSLARLRCLDKSTAQGVHRRKEHFFPLPGGLLIAKHGCFVWCNVP